MKLIALFRNYRYEIVAFLTGAAVMVLEIVGARLIAPEFGTSTFVWTAMIGVILGALAAGFAVGGRLADRYHSPAFLGRLLFVAALLVLAMGIMHEAVLVSIAKLELDIRLGALLAAAVLFGLPSFLIGMVSPHLAKIRIISLDTSGKSIGRLEAAGALGSIAGTFSCGYFLLGQFGSRSIVIGIVVLLLATSFIVDPLFWFKQRIAAFFVAALAALTINTNPAQVLDDIDSPYARYRIVARDYGNTPARILVTDHAGSQSAVPADGSDILLFGYIQRFYEAAAAYGDPKRVLVIGGGAHTFPAAVVREFPDTRVDVAEIDPALSDIAKQYFYLKDSERLKINHDDGRTYLNQNNAKYDLIFMDAFSSLSPPFQLTTKEAVERIQASLAPGGVVVVNLIGRYHDGRGEYLRAIRQTYSSVFPNVSVHQVGAKAGRGDIRQNFILYASDDKAMFADVVATAGRRMEFPPGPSLTLTDDFAPIERLTF